MYGGNLDDSERDTSAVKYILDGGAAVATSDI